MQIPTKTISPDSSPGKRNIICLRFTPIFNRSTSATPFAPLQSCFRQGIDKQ